MANGQNSGEVTSLTIDSRETGQKLIVPATLADLPQCVSLTLNDYYEENRTTAVDFMNSVPGCEQIKTLGISLSYGMDGMDLGRWVNVEELTLTPGTWSKATYPNLSRLKQLRKLTLWDHISHESARSAEEFVTQLGLLLGLREVRWYSCPLSNLEFLGELGGVEHLQVSLRFGEACEYQMPSCVAKMSRLKTFAIELVSFGDTDCVQVLRAPKDWMPYGSLVRLDLHGTNLATLDSYRELRQLLPSVEIICGRNFRDAADALARPPHEVIELNLGRLNLTSVPEALKTFVNLKKLVLLDEIDPGSFENIPSRCLEELSADCKLSFFPPAIANFSSLKDLDLGGPYGTTNAISEIPEWIGKLQLLETLWLAGNKISRFPSSISKCRNLRTLVLFNDDGDYRHGNPICSDNAAIAELRNWLPHATIVISDDE